MRRSLSLGVLFVVSLCDVALHADNELTYLADLTPTVKTVYVDANHPKFFSVRGVKATHGISGHPFGDSYSRLAFDLSQEYEELAGVAAIPDLPERGQRGEMLVGTATPLVFKILGDGKELWKSKPLQRKNEQQSFRVNIVRVKTLELQVDCPGSIYYAWAVWVDPVLSKPAAPSEKQRSANLDKPAQESPKPIQEDKTVYTWTNESGKTLNASFIGAKFDETTKKVSFFRLRREDGQEVLVPYEVLSQESREQGIDLITKRRAAERAEARKRAEQLRLASQKEAEAKREAEEKAKPDFRNVKWGMTKEQVLATEGSKLLQDSQDTLVFEAKVQGMDCHVFYFFAAKQLVRAGVIVTEKHSTAQSYLSDYLAIKRGLIEKYGGTTSDDTHWRRRLWENEPDMWGHAVATGDMWKETRWQTKTTDVVLNLSGDNDKVSLWVGYQSRALRGLLKKSDGKKLDDL